LSLCCYSNQHFADIVVVSAMKNTFLKLTVFFFLTVLVACSTEKDTFISRNYHGATAHYNGYFNANELLNTAMKGYRDGIKEDYYANLPLNPLPNEEEVKNMYVPIDTAVAKCTRVIQRHAMPSMDKPSQKREEWNRWIDENWLTIGIANYYRRDYDLALKNFSYINRFFAGDKTMYIAEMWMARTYIQQGNYTEAGFCIARLDKAAEEVLGSDKGSKSKSKSKSKKKKKKGDEEEVPDFPKSLFFDLAYTKALLAEKRGEKENMIKALEESLEYAKRKHPRARIHYALGQLKEEKGDRGGASMHYAKVLKYNPTYEMAFNARLKNALNSGGEKVKASLLKLLKDPKNAEFKDQVYYTLGLIAKQEGDEPKTIENFTNSAFYSTTNKRQKGLSYENLGDIYFGKKDYYRAQKYYDSCARVIPETYPNYEGVKRKAEKLQSLVVAIETAQLEDSLQRISTMSSEDQYAFAEKVIAQMKADEAKRKELEAIRLATLQQQQASKANQNSGKGYWGNPKAKQEGFEEFKRQWGQRANEDDWRRSEKVQFATFDDPKDDSLGTKKPVDISSSPLDSLTPEMLLANVPNTDSTLAQSQERMMKALFDAGKIYQDQLNETGLAETQYNTIVGKPFESEYKLLAAYQMYRMYQPTDPKATVQRDYILTNYPTSDYAGYLRDPDYFIKKKEREKQTQVDYLKDLERYENGLYYLVVTKANSVITEQKDNPYLPKYYLLKAKAQAKLNEDKRTLLPTLDTLIMKYPGTDEARKGTEMRNIILNGYSSNTVVDFNKKGLYEYTDKEPFTVIIFLEGNVNNNVAKTRVVDFNKEFFSKSKLNIASKELGTQSTILVREFPTEALASDYAKTYKKTRQHLLDMQKFKILYVSQSNLKILFETGKLAEYEVFFTEYY